MRKTIRTILLILLLIIVVFTALIFDTSPRIEVSSANQVGNADTVQPLVNELKTSLRSRYDAQEINVSIQQANSLAGFIDRAIEDANAEVGFTDDRVIIAGTYKIKTGLFPLYVNIKAVVLEGNAFILEYMTIGDLRLPGALALGIMESLANTYTSSKIATKALATVSFVAVDNDRMQLSLAPLDSLLREVKNIETGGSRADARILKIKIAHYLRLLDNLFVPATATNTKSPSLSIYLHAVMKEAAILSEQSSATLENEAAILALAIYAGSGRFTALIGDLSFAIEKIPYASPKPVLAGRKDLSLHFIFSAAIKLLSQKGISIAVGEFKELMDRGQGGSGYSFVDLAADLSGAHFADLAVNPQTAKMLQTIMMEAPNEALFMVSIDELDEGLSKSQFSEQYGEVDSERYKQIVDKINRRINDLVISQE